MARKYKSPYHWLHDYLVRPTTDLSKEALYIATSLDADEIEHLYADDMEEDGYYEEEENDGC